MFIVVAYDIPDDRRRTRLHKALKHFGSPVQWRVFECHLTARQLEQMKRVIAEIFDERTDHVRFYYLCEMCVRRNEATRASRRTSDPKAVIL